jgi:hypothetical protein
MDDNNKTQMDLLNEFLVNLANARLGYRRKLVILNRFNEAIRLSANKK